VHQPPKLSKNFQIKEKIMETGTILQTHNSVQELMGDIASGYQKTLAESKDENWAELQKNRQMALEGKNFSVMPWNEVLEILSGKWQPPPPPPVVEVEPEIEVEAKPKRARKATAKKATAAKSYVLTPATMAWGEMLKILAGKATLASLTEDDIDKATESLKDPKDCGKNNATRSPGDSIEDFVSGFAFE
jgi:hypothetical protein